MTSSTGAVAHKVKRLAHLDLAGAGQVTVRGRHAFVGHIPNKQNLGTSILDISDPLNPRVVSTITLDDPTSHSHKVRVVGDVMIVNHERNATPVGRRAEQLPGTRAALRAALGREPTPAELAAKMNVTESDLQDIQEAERRGYHNGGFKIYDIADPERPRLVAYQKTGGIGVHRFSMDERYAYITTEMDGFIGAFLVIYDVRDPAHPAEVSRWWLPGQHLAGEEKPSWSSKRHRLHHVLRFGDELWASCWHAGFRIIDIADIAKPRTIGAYNYHPLLPEPTHTVMPLPTPIAGRRIAVSVDEEDQALNASEENARRGRLHAGIATFDASDPAAIKPLAVFCLSELDSPFARVSGARFGAHQFHERAEGTLVYATWFGGGLRIIDLADPSAPREIGCFIPDPAGGRPAPQSNDVILDDRGLIYLVDRHVGFDVLETSL
ncbi:MAG TPA: sigma-70 domain-containing protein [Pseudolabrys sp.]|nr:sigma-70 domain-containing protein [Pseudolabrys sp.]